MNKNKKIAYILMCVVLNLAILACRFPYLGRIADVPVEETITSPQESAAAIDQEPQVTVAPEETQAPTPVQLVTATPMEVVVEDPSAKQVYSDNGVQISLPGTFVLGDVEEGLAAIMENQEFLSGDGAGSIKALIEQYQGNVLLWGLDNSEGQNQETNLVVLKNKQLANMSLGLVSTFLNMMLGSQGQVADQQQMQLNGREVLRIQISADTISADGNQVMYLFKEANYLWIVGFFTNAGVGQDDLSIFDDAVASFTILDSE